MYHLFIAPFDKDKLECILDIPKLRSERDEKFSENWKKFRSMHDFSNRPWRENMPRSYLKANAFTGVAFSRE